MSDPRNEGYANIRELIGEFIGKTVIDVSQHDEEDWAATGAGFVVLMFSDGSLLKFYVPQDTIAFEAQIVGKEAEEYELDFEQDNPGNQT